MEPFAASVIAGRYSRVDKLQRVMLDRPEAILEDGKLYDPKEWSFFLPGLYIRGVTNPAGSLTVTKKHKVEHRFFLVRGRLRVKDLETGETVEMVAPHEGITYPGTQRLIFAPEESEFITVHLNPDNETDEALLEERYIERQELADGKTMGELYRERLRLLGDG
jgi:hypothetical protein